jgi:1,2-diacylglycerol 3-alpha-glucosyltransferase
MRAALFTDSYLPNTDGVVSSIMAYRRGLEASGHSWVIFAPDVPGYKDAKGDEVLRFPGAKFPPYPEYRAVLSPFSIPSRLAQKHHLQLVHSKAMMSMGVAAYSFAHRSRLPCMASVETMIPDGVHYLSKNRQVQAFGKDVAWSYLKWLYSHFDLVTAPSRHTRARLARHGIESEVLPSPVDTDVFKPNAKDGARIRKELGFSSKTKLVLSVGRVVKEKNYDFILRAAQKMRDPDVRFLIVGKGPYLDTLKKEAQRMGIFEKVHFTGYILTKPQLVSYYNAADAFIFASKFETQGLTLLEAFACGKPAAVLEGTAMEELVRAGRNGQIFLEDEEECGEKLLSCIGAKKRLSVEARKTALEYSIPVLTKRMLSLYSHLLQ